MADPAPTQRRYWLDDRRNVDKVFWAVVVVCALLFAADFFYDKHAKFALEGIFGFFGIFGFVCCVFLVLAAKELRKLLKRPEDYYDR
ncbi:MAG: hypothetical protein KIT16_12215 [Rhodospirillaceae bacterium]|nr:hypothetical protein [Rhodospirillaceae bacterium]